MLGHFADTRALAEVAMMDRPEGLEGKQYVFPEGGI
jgi:hypothetical protein